MAELAVTDTHALVWSAQQKWRKLGREARRTFEAAEAGRAVIYVPTLVLAEVSDMLHRGSLKVRGGLAEWVKALDTAPGYSVADLTADIVLRARALYAIPDPFDRLIAATAAELDCPLITKDADIRGAGILETVW